MARRNQFIISNSMAKPLLLAIEPEGSFYPLQKGQEVSVTDRYTSAPVTVKVTNSEQGDTILSIWPGDGDVTIEKDGVDVLDLVQTALDVRSE